MGGEFTYPKMVPLALTHSHIVFSGLKGGRKGFFITQSQPPGCQKVCCATSLEDMLGPLHSSMAHHSYHVQVGLRPPSLVLSG